MLLIVAVYLAIFAAASDAAVTFTTPASGKPACSGMGTVEEGTTSGTIETAVASTDGADLVLSLETETAKIFAINAATGAVTISDGTKLDFENGATIDVIIEGNDNGGTAKSATCVLTITNKAPSFVTTFRELVLVSSAGSGDAIGTYVCSDGAGTITTFGKSGDDDTAKFDLGASTGALTKSADAFDTTQTTLYTLVITCSDGEFTATTTTIICLDSETNCPNSSSKIGVLTTIIVTTMFSLFQLL